MAVLTALFGLAASAAHGGPPPHPPHPPHPRIFEQATATVHIVAGVRVEHDKPPETAMVRQAIIRDAQGDCHAAELIEFP